MIKKSILCVLFIIISISQNLASALEGNLRLGISYGESSINDEFVDKVEDDIESGNFKSEPYILAKKKEDNNYRGNINYSICAFYKNFGIGFDTGLIFANKETKFYYRLQNDSDRIASTLKVREICFPQSAFLYFKYSLSEKIVLKAGFGGTYYIFNHMVSYNTQEDYGRSKYKIENNNNFSSYIGFTGLLGISIFYNNNYSIDLGISRNEISGENYNNTSFYFGISEYIK